MMENALKCDLKSVLNPGDLFVSYWLDEHMMVIVGDHYDIYAVDSLPVGNLNELITAFEMCVTRTEHYAHFIVEKFRPFDWPLPDELELPMSEILAALSSLVVTSELAKRVLSQNYRRLIVCPDGMLHALPIHLLIDRATGSLWHETFSDGILYAPNASSYIYACAKRRKEKPMSAVILVGDAQDTTMVLEAENVKAEMPCPTEIITRMDDLQNASQRADILYIACHGQSPESADVTATMDSTDTSGWSLTFDKSSLASKDFFSERIKVSRGAVVVLSACSVGRLMAGPVHELDGLIQSLFYAGAATVLAARWPIVSQSAEAVFGGTIERVFGSQMNFGSALNAAIKTSMGREDLTRLMVGPEAYPFFWGPFALFGCGN